MPEFAALEPVDYLVFGHLSVDLTPAGPRLGGTVSYSGLAARALGMRVGIVTSAAPDAPLDELAGIPLVTVPASHSTTFENIPAPEGRRQVIHGRAEPLLLEHIPAAWRTAPILHLAPLAQEFPPAVASKVSASLVGLTPQGWMRAWDEQGHIRHIPLHGADQFLPHISAMILSLEDVNGDLERIEYFAHHTRLLAVTEAEGGSVLYWNGDRRRFRAPKVEEIDATGAGDIYAAAFFVRLYTTRDPWEAARFATHFAACSVTRRGLDGIPTQSEIQACMTEVLF
ncbi:MAG: PfkB family carbohydrate kinase [Bacteroidota bacterium]